MNIKNLVLGIVIFLLTMSVGVYGISTFLGKGPQYDKYCPQIGTEEDCINASGKWINYTNTGPVVAEPGTKPIPSGGGYCEYSYIKCQKDYDDANRKYTRSVFFIALPLGIIVIAIGGLVFGLEAVGGGIMFGGIGIILFGVVNFWQYADDVFKFILSGIGLVIVIGLAYYFNKKFKK